MATKGEGDEMSHDEPVDNVIDLCSTVMNDGNGSGNGSKMESDETLDAVVAGMEDGSEFDTHAVLAEIIDTVSSMTEEGMEVGESSQMISGKIVNSISNDLEFPLDVWRILLSYFPRADLQNFASCSEPCNELVQEFNKTAPVYVKIRDCLLFEQPAFEVMMSFSKHATVTRFTNVGQNKHYRFDEGIGRFDKEVYDGDIHEAGYAYLEKKLHSMTAGRIKEFEIEVNEWNDQLLSFQALRNSERFIIRIAESNYLGFLNDMNQRNRMNSKFIIVQKDRGDLNHQDFVMPQSFFDSRFYLQSPTDIVVLPIEPMQSHLHVMQRHATYYTPFITTEIFSYVIDLWLRDPSAGINLEIYVPAAAGMRYDKEEIMRYMRNAIVGEPGEDNAEFNNGKHAEFVFTDKYAIFKQI